MEEIIHGGNLLAAEKKFGIKVQDWLDLSTGINPNPWPIPEIPIQIWGRLPDETDDLLEAAKNYYACDSLLPIPGSQFAIQTLPTLFPKGTAVAIPKIGYQEHRAAWQREEHKLYYYSDDELNEIDNKIKSGKLSVVIAINPNNPSCTIISKEKLNSWLALLKEREGYLIIDEAFMDSTPEQSMVDALDSNNLIILKSPGKFFGLAGLRLGFALVKDEIRHRLKQQLGPWGVNHPARWIGAKALADKQWQQQTRDNLHAESKRLNQYITSCFPANKENINNTHLFTTIRLDKNAAIERYNRLGQQGVLIRHIETGEQQDYLRFGLIKDELMWQKFKLAMKNSVPPV